MWASPYQAFPSTSYELLLERTTQRAFGRPCPAGGCSLSRPRWVGVKPSLLPGLVPTVQGVIVQSPHALGPSSQLAKTRLGLLAAGYFESTKNDLGGEEGRIAQEKHYYSIIFSSSVNS